MKRRNRASMREKDVYEAEDALVAPEERAGSSRRHDSVPTLEYSLPEEYEDEEIDEEEAFNSEDEEKWKGTNFGGAKKSGKSKNANVVGSKVESSENEEDYETTDSETEMYVSSEGGSDDGGSEGDEVQYRNLLQDVRIGREARVKSARVTVSESCPESEFNMNLGADTNGEQEKLTIGHLLQGLGDRKGMEKIKKSLQKLESKAKPAETSLPKAIREREERKAGYNIAKQEVSKWKDLVKHNREQRTLVFSRPSETLPRLSTAAFAAKFEAENDMEKQVADLLKQAKADEDQKIMEDEGIEMKKMSEAEVQERREKLAKMRALMFYQEERSKRLKKIKSKEYHRRQNKTAQKVAERLALLDGSDEEALREEALKAEYARAEERLTLKHRNTSRWARRALKKGLHNSKPGVKEMLVEQMRIGEGLRQKILGTDDGDISSDSEVDEATEQGTDAADGASLKFKSETLELLETGELELPEKGLFALPFMKRAIEKKKQQVEVEAHALLEELDGEDGEENMTGDATDWITKDKGGPANGRIRIGGGKGSNKTGAMVLKDDFDEEEQEYLKALNSDEALHGKSKQKQSSARHASGAPTFKHGSVIEERGSHGGAGMSIHGPQVKGNGIKEVVSTDGVDNKGDRQCKGSVNRVKLQKEQAHKSTDVSRDTVNIAGMVDPPQPQNAMPRSRAIPRPEGPQQEKNAAALAKQENGERKRDQQEVYRMKFVDNDMLEEFKKEKEEAVGVELPEVEEFNVMPGWGGWADQQRKPRWMIKAEEENRKKREAAAAARKDARLPHVIISEKYDRKAASHGSESVPYPFTSKQAFEASMRMPIGKDFNTDGAFRNLSRPDVLTPGAGVIIGQLQYKDTKLPKRDSGVQKLNKRKLLEIAKVTTVKTRPKHARLD